VSVEDEHNSESGVSGENGKWKLETGNWKIEIRKSRIEIGKSKMARDAEDYESEVTASHLASVL
jgi:hypothetical protein